MGPTISLEFYIPSGGIEHAVWGYNGFTRFRNWKIWNITCNSPHRELSLPRLYAKLNARTLFGNVIASKVSLSGKENT